MNDLIDWEHTKKHALNWSKDMAERYLLGIAGAMMLVGLLTFAITRAMA